MFLRAPTMRPRCRARRRSRRRSPRHRRGRSDRLVLPGQRYQRDRWDLMHQHRRWLQRDPRAPVVPQARFPRCRRAGRADPRGPQFPERPWRPWRRSPQWLLSLRSLRSPRWLPWFPPGRCCPLPLVGPRGRSVLPIRSALVDRRIRRAKGRRARRRVRCARTYVPPVRAARTVVRDLSINLRTTPQEKEPPVRGNPRSTPAIRPGEGRPRTLER